MITYAKSASASHFSTLAICAYLRRIVAQAIATPNTTTKMWESTPESVSAASAIPERSAATLIVLAMKSDATTPARTGRGNFFLSAAPRP